MVGTTRSRVSHFINKFRMLGFIDYSDNVGLTVHSGLLSVVLHDSEPTKARRKELLSIRKLLAK
jgi:CRP/FNR family transcriptional regulator, cyclic AMP receptor protein